MTSLQMNFGRHAITPPSTPQVPRYVVLAAVCSALLACFETWERDLNDADTGSDSGCDSAWSLDSASLCEPRCDAGTRCVGPGVCIGPGECVFDRDCDDDRFPYCTARQCASSRALDRPDTPVEPAGSVGLIIGFEIANYHEVFEFSEVRPSLFWRTTPGLPLQPFVSWRRGVPPLVIELHEEQVRLWSARWARGPEVSLRSERATLFRLLNPLTSTLDLLELLQSVEGAVDLRAQSVTLLGSWQVAEANRSADSIRLRTLRDSGAFPAEPIVFWESSGGYGTTTNFLLQHFPSLGRAMGSPWDHTVRVYDSEWYGRVDVMGNALASGVQTITAPPLQIGDVTFDYRAEIPTTTLFWWGVINAEDEVAALIRYLEREGCGCNANLAAFPESLDFVCGGGPDVHIWDTFLDPARARVICPYAPEWCLAPDGLRNFLLPLFTDMDGDPASEGLHFHIGVHVVPIDTLRNVP